MLPNPVPPSKLPMTPRAKKIIEYAIEEARKLNHNYVGTEHLLLGLIRERDGVGAHVLMNMNLGLTEVRDEVINVLGVGVEQTPLPMVEPIPALAAEPATPPTHRPDYTLMPHRLPEAWISLAIGGLLLFLFPNTPQYLLSLAHLAAAPLPFNDGTPYGQSWLVVPDAAVSAFAAMMILVGLVILIAPWRKMLMFVSALMAVAVVFHVLAMILHGFQIACAIAVALGGYEIIYLLGLLGATGKRVKSEG